jgi:hypothetical protein
MAIILNYALKIIGNSMIIPSPPAFITGARKNKNCSKCGQPLKQTECSFLHIVVMLLIVVGSVIGLGNLFAFIAG